MRNPYFAEIEIGSDFEFDGVRYQRISQDEALPISIRGEIRKFYWKTSVERVRSEPQL